MLLMFYDKCSNQELRITSHCVVYLTTRYKSQMQRLQRIMLDPIELE